ncbi:MAG: hypothetical protein ACT4PM_09040 [Gemmatimonadales bacterium]
MHIELTDHLICPAGHAEQYLVLLPETMEGRRVITGDLGCPVCGRVVRVRTGIADFGPPPTAQPGAAEPSGRPAVLTAEAMHAFLGLTGPGGFVALAGRVAAVADELSERMPGIGLVLVNRSAGPVPGTPAASVLRSPRLPLKSNSMRGVVIGADLADLPGGAWIADAARAVLPGLRVVSEGGEPPATLTLLAQSGSCWVGIKPSSRPGRSEF